MGIRLDDRFIKNNFLILKNPNSLGFFYGIIFVFVFKKFLSLHYIPMRMIKKYFYTILIFSVLFAFEGHSQVNKSQEPTIEGLTIYPNPVNSGKIYVTSKSSLDKKIEIFDVLGKKVLETTTSNKEVNISNLTAGIYIIKIKEGDNSATRKLIVN